MAKRPNKADPFDVWGKPPQALAKGLTERQMNLLRAYTEATATSVYRLAFDNGVSHAFGIVSETVGKEWKRQRDRVARS
jgi:hypothetical protein